jgi:uncharacterized membrane protein YjjB (DUF3815 family)
MSEAEFPAIPNHQGRGKEILIYASLAAIAGGVVYAYRPKSGVKTDWAVLGGALLVGSGAIYIASIRAEI